MPMTATLDLAIWRNDLSYTYTVLVRGVDLTDLDVRAQIRLAPDTPGAPLVDLPLVMTPVQGIAFAGVETVDGVPTSTLLIRLDLATRQALPYAGELGDSIALSWALLIAGLTRLTGSVTILAHAYGSGAAPANRPMAYGVSHASSPATGATLTIAGEEITQLSVDGIDLLAPMVADAQAAQVATAADRAALSDGLVHLQSAPFRTPDTPANPEYDLDAAGRVMGYRTPQGERREAGNPHGLTTQSLLRRSGAAPALLPAGFQPLGSPIPAAGRYIWAGMPRELRPDPTSLAVTGYPFQWPPDPVPPSQVRRARGTIGSPAWALDPITVANGPLVDFLRVQQYRDLSTMRDRKTGLLWQAVNCIQRSVNGYVSSRFAISSSPDGLAWTMVGYVEIPIPTMQVWSPEWSVDDNGELYVLVAVNANPQVFTTGDYLASQWGYHLLRCDDLPTAQFTYLGALTGNAFPRQADGNTSMIDPFRFKRNGVWHTIWKAEPSASNRGTLNVLGTDVPYGTLGYAVSTDMLSGYDQGAPFRLADGSTIQGEGQYVMELPAGQPHRYRLGFDDYKTLYGGGSCFADTDDFLTFPNGVQPLPVSGIYNRHTTFVIGL